MVKAYAQMHARVMTWGIGGVRCVLSSRKEMGCIYFAKPHREPRWLSKTL